MASSAAGLAILPLAEAYERAGLLSAFYVEGYLSFSLPAIVTGLVIPLVGLRLPLTFMAPVLAIISLIATRRARS